MCVFPVYFADSGLICVSMHICNFCSEWIKLSSETSVTAMQSCGQGKLKHIRYVIREIMSTLLSVF